MGTFSDFREMGTGLNLVVTQLPGSKVFRPA